LTEVVTKDPDLSLTGEVFRDLMEFISDFIMIFALDATLVPPWDETEPNRCSFPVYSDFYFHKLI
jgi:hypothetical protein